MEGRGPNSVFPDCHKYLSGTKTYEFVLDIYSAPYPSNKLSNFEKNILPVKFDLYAYLCGCLYSQVGQSSKISMYADFTTLANVDSILSTCGHTVHCLIVFMGLL